MVEMLKEEIGDKLRELQNENGATYERMAERIDISGRYYKDLCSGKKEPSASTIVKICISLKISSDWLLGLDLKQAAEVPASVEQRLGLLHGQNEALEKEAIRKDIEIDSLRKRLTLETEKSAKLTLKGQAEMVKNIPSDILGYIPYISSTVWQMIRDITQKAKSDMEKAKMRIPETKKRSKRRTT